MPNTDIKRQLEQRTWGAMLTYAFMRFESALVIAVVLVLTFLLPHPFSWWPWWGWIALGVVGEALIVFTSLTDPATSQAVVADMLREQYNPGHLITPKRREQVERALTYRRSIAALLAQKQPGSLRDRLDQVAADMDAWLGQIYRLAERLDQLTTDSILTQDRQSAVQEMRDLQARLTLKNDPSVRQSLELAVKGRQAQVDTLKHLDETVDRAEAQMEATLAALATIYSQMVLIGAREGEGASTDRLTDNIQEQVAALKDVLDAMDEVYRSRGTPSPAT